MAALGRRPALLHFPGDEPPDGRPALSLLAAAAGPSTLAIVHQRLGFALILVFLVGMVAALTTTRRTGQLPTVRAYLWLAFLAVTVQAALGLVLLGVGERPGDVLHYLYGPLTFLSLPVAAAVSRGGSARREAWLLAAGFLAALLFSIRTLTTA
jgi:heme A synthase